MRFAEKRSVIMDAFRSSRIVNMTTTTIALLLVVAVVVVEGSGHEFDPYQLNGGLLSAVAGRGYVMVACDTRLSRHYEILTRNYVDIGGSTSSSRLWSVPATPHMPRIFHPAAFRTPTTASSSCTPSSMTTTTPMMTERMTFIGSAGCEADCNALRRAIQSDVHAHVCWNCGGGGDHGAGASSHNILSTSSVASLLSNTLYSRRAFPYYAFCIVAGLDDEGNDDDDADYQHHDEEQGGGGGGEGMDDDDSMHATTHDLHKKVLERTKEEEEEGDDGVIRRTIATTTVTSMGDMSEDIMTAGTRQRSRRRPVRGRHHRIMNGVVHVYDAIGSHERVAVATAGTGREMLQPILDTLLETSNLEVDRVDDDDERIKRRRSTRQIERQKNYSGSGGGVVVRRHDDHDNHDEDETPHDSADDDGLVPFRSSPSDADHDHGLHIAPPVRTRVSCHWEEAIRHVIHAYRSVAEREMAVGDGVVVYVLRQHMDHDSDGGIDNDDDNGRERNKNGDCSSNVYLQKFYFPLKSH